MWAATTEHRDPFAWVYDARAVHRSALPFSPRAVALVALVALAVFVGCPSRPRGPDIGRLPLLTSANPQAESELRQARELTESGDMDGGETRYRAFLEKHPDDPLAPVARLSLGRILLKRGNVQAAHALFAEVALHPNAAVAEQGRFYGGVTSHALGRHREAIAVLQPMVGRTIDPPETALLLRTLASAMIATEDVAGAITTLDRLVAEDVAEDERKEARSRIADLARNKARPEEVAALYRDLPSDGAAWPHVLRRVVRDADAAGDSERVRQLLEEMRDRDLDIDDEMALIATRAERPADANPQVIGAVLTLSGRARHVGELALRGLMLAADLPPKGPLPPDAPQLVFRDDAGDPARAVAAVEELASVHRAIAIVGPLDARAAEAAATRAHELGVPILTLAPAARIDAAHANVFRMFATPQAEVAALVAHARAQRATRFAVLAPEGPFGDTLVGALAHEVAGATPVRAVRYPSGTTSFGAQATALAKEEFDALLVADRASTFALIAPALAAAGLWSGPALGGGARGILLLAPSIAFDPALVGSVGRYLQGAVFSVPFGATLADGPGRAFADRFQAQFGETPDAFAAFAHDAYRLARTTVDAGARTRADLGRALPRTRSDTLAGPASGFGAGREPLRPTRLWRVDGDRLVADTAP
jgi:ABC-type branched-subunit amino acid transport system substrate-binding protein